MKSPDEMKPEEEKTLQENATATNDKTEEAVGSVESSNTEAGADETVKVDIKPDVERVGKDKTAEDKSAPEGMTGRSESNAAFYIRVTGVLTAICVVVALMLSFVNGITVDRINENTLKQKINAAKSIFSEYGADDAAQLDYEVTSPVASVWVVTAGGKTVGYSANVESTGFGGTIDMMVGADTEGKTVGVSIVSMSETPGLGSKTNDESFIGQFKGKSGTITVGAEIDAVAGATISSKAVTAGVNNALAAMKPLFDGTVKAKPIAPQAGDTQDDDAERPTPADTNAETVLNDDGSALAWIQDGITVAQSFSPLPKAETSPTYVVGGNTVYEEETEAPEPEDVIDPEMHYGEPETSAAETAAPETSAAEEVETAEITETSETAESDEATLAFETTSGVSVGGIVVETDTTETADTTAADASSAEEASAETTVENETSAETESAPVDETETDYSTTGYNMPVFLSEEARISR